MPDDQSSSSSPNPWDDVFKTVQMLQSAGLLGGGAANAVQMPTVAPVDTGPPVDRSWTSRIGEALAGGPGAFPMTSAQREAAGM
jgi:hypothetical protein